MLFKKPAFFKSPLEHYRENIENIMGESASVFREKSVKKNLPFVYNLTFPKNNLSPLSAFTYGASFALTPDQAHKRELCIQMDSNDMAWAHVLAYLANQLRGDCPFNPGELIRFGQKITDESNLNAFIVTEPTFIKVENPIPDGRKSKGVQLMELIPIYEQEFLAIQKMGLPEFLKRIKSIKLDPTRNSL